MRPQRSAVKRRILAKLLAAIFLVTVSRLSATAAGPGLVRIDVTIGKSQVIEVKEPFDRVSVTDPNIADVFIIKPNQILINGKAVGVTSLVVFYPEKTQFFDLVVQTDLELLRERLKQITPRDAIEVRAAQEAIVLHGEVSSEEMINAGAQIASAFAPKGKVINLLALRNVKVPQILIQVQVAEVLRSALKELGFSFRVIDGVFQGGAFPGNAFFPPLGLIGAVESPEIQFSPETSFFLASPNREYAGMVRALADRDLLRILAKPNLVTQSGKEASFLSGGEFPYPVPQTSGAGTTTITVVFKPFGVELTFLPVVVDGEEISMKVTPSVSRLDFTTGLSFAGFDIPVLRKNAAFTNVNLKDGESFAIAGLINNEVRQAVSKIPLLGDIPILGTLFRSTRFQNNESELVFVVTVKLVQPGPIGSPTVPDPLDLLKEREVEKQEFTLVPGIPRVGDVVEQPLGKSNFPQQGN